MSEDTRRVLDLLAQGKVTVDEADDLLRALGDQPGSAETAPATKPTSQVRPRYLRIQVHKPANAGREAKDVNIRVPMAIVRGGMRLSRLIPGLEDHVSARSRESGVAFDFSKLDPAEVESILGDMGEMNIEINGTGEQVRITAE